MLRSMYQEYPAKSKVHVIRNAKLNQELPSEVVVAAVEQP